MIRVRTTAIALVVWIVSASSIAASPPSLEQDYAKLCAGGPKPASETCEALRKALIAKLSDRPPGAETISSTTVAPAPATQAPPDEMHRRWGLYAEMVGKSYFDRFTSGEPSGISNYAWKVPGVELEVTRYSATSAGKIKAEKECLPIRINRRFDPGTNKILRTIQMPCWPELAQADVVIQPDGSSVETEIPRTTGPKAFRGKYRDRITLRKDGTVRSSRQERKRDGSYENLGFGTTVSHERTPEYLASLRAEQQRLAQTRENSSGNSGVLGAVAMGLGAALAGGNPGQVMGMAMKGAELTTDNEMSRNVLAGQGDAMVAAGTQQMVAENGSSAAASTAPPSSAPIGGQPSPALGSTADSETTYYDCFGVVKKRTSAGDVTDTIYYGIVTSSRADPDAARNLFRQHTGSDAASDTESSGVGCHPYKTRAEAQTHNNAKIARDSNRSWRQVTGIALSL